ncbi:MAG: hypothetical protein M3680_28580 [Myxococcota bacterium]|nr:hypothetical protein [Myxococcota bacterium]
MPELHARAPWTGHGAEAREQHAGHDAIVGHLDESRKRWLSPPAVDPDRAVLYLVFVNRLIEYLRQHLMIDFQGDLTVAKVRELLAGDDSRDAKQLLSKIVAEKSVEDMFIVLADCLLEPVQKALTDDVMRENIRMYSES